MSYTANNHWSPDESFHHAPTGGRVVDTVYFTMVIQGIRHFKVRFTSSDHRDALLAQDDPLMIPWLAKAVSVGWRV